MKQVKNVIRQDAYAKVTGKARYVDDLRFPGMLFVQTVRSPHPHAEILDIDFSKALAAEGVVCVLTAKDVPGINHKPKDKPVLADKEAKCAGDGVAIVVAAAKAQAENAASLINVSYRVLPAVFTAEEALKEGAPLVHGDSNIAFAHKIVKGDIAAGFAEADIIIEREYSTQRAMHSAIEPDGAVAVPEANGITLYCPGKGPFNVKRAVASAIGLPESEVRLIQPVIGGAFGGKDCDINIIASRAAIAALRTGKPCKMTWSREEVLTEGTKRHPFLLRYKVGAKKDGRITAMEISGITDVGAYISKSRATIWRAAVEATGPYNVDNVSTTITGVFTNNVYSDAVRGFGSPQVDFASESVINELAKELGMSALEIRRRCGYREGSITATGQKLEGVSLMECLDKLEEVFPVNAKPSPPGKDKARGRGISCIFRGEARGACSIVYDSASVMIHPEEDGSMTVQSGIAEMGQGGGNIVLQVISETLGVPAGTLRLNPLDTNYVADSGPTTGSRGTITSGNAAAAAAKDLMDKMSGLLARKWGVMPEDIAFGDSRVFSGGHCASFKDAVSLCLKEIPGFCGYGSWSLPPVTWDYEKHCGNTYASYNYGVCGAEVEVDLVSGKVDVISLVAIHDVGHILNEPEARGQIAGGVSMALGLALSEKVSVRNGKVTSLNFDKYLLPTVLDFHELAPIPLEAKPGANPLGVKGVGESSSATVAPAVINAIEDAVGVRIRHLPADLESVFAAVQSMEAKHER